MLNLAWMTVPRATKSNLKYYYSNQLPMTVTLKEQAWRLFVAVHHTYMSLLLMLLLLVKLKQVTQPQPEVTLLIILDFSFYSALEVGQEEESI